MSGKRTDVAEPNREWGLLHRSNDMARRRSNYVALDIIPMVAALLVLPLALAPGLAPAILGLATLVVISVAGSGGLALIGLVVVRLANGRTQRVDFQTSSVKSVRLNVTSGSVEAADVRARGRGYGAGAKNNCRSGVTLFPLKSDCTTAVQLVKVLWEKFTSFSRPLRMQA